MICPICRRGYPAGVQQCAKDHERLVPYAEFVSRREQSVPERICPTCGTRYPGTTKFCGKDGTTLG
jgi:predicted nucleic acid-binding Zn ribbon protein